MDGVGKMICNTFMNVGSPPLSINSSNIKGIVVLLKNICTWGPDWVRTCEYFHGMNGRLCWDTHQCNTGHLWGQIFFMEITIQICGRTSNRGRFGEGLRVKKVKYRDFLMYIYKLGFEGGGTLWCTDGTRGIYCSISIILRPPLVGGAPSAWGVN